MVHLDLCDHLVVEIGENVLGDERKACGGREQKEEHPHASDERAPVRPEYLRQAVGGGRASPAENKH